MHRYKFGCETIIMEGEWKERHGQDLGFWKMGTRRMDRIKWIDIVNNGVLNMSKWKQNKYKYNPKKGGKLDRTYYERKGILMTVLEGKLEGKKRKEFRGRRCWTTL